MAQLTINYKPAGQTYDVIVAGGGTAGVMAACAAARATSSAATPLADSEAAVRSDVAAKLLCSTPSRICSSVMVSSAMEYHFLDSPS